MSALSRRGKWKFLRRNILVPRRDLDFGFLRGPEWTIFRAKLLPRASILAVVVALRSITLAGEHSSQIIVL